MLLCAQFIPKSQIVTHRLQVFYRLNPNLRWSFSIQPDFLVLYLNFSCLYCTNKKFPLFFLNGLFSLDIASTVCYFLLLNYYLKVVRSEKSTKHLHTFMSTILILFPGHFQINLLQLKVYWQNLAFWLNIKTSVVLYQQILEIIRKSFPKCSNLQI